MQSCNNYRHLHLQKALNNYNDLNLSNLSTLAILTLYYGADPDKLPG